MMSILTPCSTLDDKQSDGAFAPVMRQGRSQAPARKEKEMLLRIGTVGERGIDPRPDSAIRNLLIEWTQWAPGYSCDLLDTERFCILNYVKPEPYEEN